MVAVSETLDRTFHALSNATRREVVARLGAGPATVSELAEPFDMALPSFMQHLRTLESCGLVRSRKQGRTRTVRLDPANVRKATGWLLEQRAVWEKRLDQLDSYLKNLETPND